VASEAALALGFEGNSGAVAALVARLAAADSTRAISAADALASIGASSQPALGVALGNGGQTSYYASRSLTKQGPVAVPAIVKAASSGPVAARWAATALGGIGGAESRQGLEAIAQSTDAEAKQIASNALTRMNMN
jgi:hypothetical protein